MRRPDAEIVHTIICRTLEDALHPGSTVPNRDGYVTPECLNSAIVAWQEANIPESELAFYETAYNIREIIGKRGIGLWFEGFPRKIVDRKEGRVYTYKGYEGLTKDYRDNRRFNDTAPISQDSLDFIKGSVNFSLLAAIRNRIREAVKDALDKATQETKALYGPKARLSENRRKLIAEQVRPKAPFLCYEDSEFEYADDYGIRSFSERQILLAFADAIIRRLPVKLTYKPLHRDGNAVYEFHPHYIRHVGHKLMVYGESRRLGTDDRHVLVNVILRRVSGLQTLDGVNYIGPEARGIDYNNSFFRHSMTFNARIDNPDRETLTRVVLRVYRTKQALVGGRTICPYERILSEPLHHSQQICEDYPADDKFGYISLHINDHMFIKPILLAYGGDLEVIEPLELRELMAAEVRRLTGLYGREIEKLV